MKKYILGRFIRSVISILAVVCIAITLVYTLIPREKVFYNDPNYTKMKDDAKISYVYGKWRDLGYLEFKQAADLCSEASDYNACMAGGEELNTIVDSYESKGFTVGYMPKSKLVYVYKDYTVPQLIGNFFGSLVKIDNPSAVSDPNNLDLERGYYIDTNTPNGLPAIACTGCQYQYQLYVDGHFPFIHQNAFRLNFGKSFPTFSGIDTLTVINQGQGDTVSEEITFPTGVTQKSPLNLYTCQYKSSATMDHLDKKKFDTNYANCASNYSDPSMTGLSYMFGIMALVLAYAIALPAGIGMAMNKDKWQDKLGIVYINFMIAVPSLAFIFFAKSVGMGFGFPDKFPQYGSQDVRSYILPVIILALLSTAGIMIWIRRYMIDQSNADYVKFARAKGLTQGEIFRKHILKNAIIPIVNGIPGSIILCISGSVITETVFAIPGMGKMLPDSIKAYNNTMVITLTFIFTSLSIFSLLIGDLLMTVVDPRIQLSAKGDRR